MQLDIRGAAAVLNVPESTIYRWIEQKKLPAKGCDGVYRVARTELLEWATAHDIELSPDIFNEEQVDHDELSLSAALAAGGILDGIGGADKSSILRSMLSKIALPKGFGPDFLQSLFLSREAMGMAAIGGGIAVPHARHPVVVPVMRPSLTLCFLEKPMAMAPGAEPLHTLFVLLSPTIQMHLQMLPRITSLVRDEGVERILAKRASRAEILGEVRRVEKTFSRSAADKNPGR
jgi:PTS system nitrogen regulatory IIA component